MCKFVAAVGSSFHRCGARIVCLYRVIRVYMLVSELLCMIVLLGKVKFSLNNRIHSYFHVLEEKGIHSYF
jgi:hypothetical protein